MKLTATDQSVPVLIVGGGGGGLTASMLLARQGVRQAEPAGSGVTS